MPDEKQDQVYFPPALQAIPPLLQLAGLFLPPIRTGKWTSYNLGPRLFGAGGLGGALMQGIEQRRAEAASAGGMRDYLQQLQAWQQGDRKGPPPIEPSLQLAGKPWRSLISKEGVDLVRGADPKDIPIGGGLFRSRPGMDFPQMLMPPPPTVSAGGRLSTMVPPQKPGEPYTYQEGAMIPEVQRSNEEVKKYTDRANQIRATVSDPMQAFKALEDLVAEVEGNSWILPEQRKEFRASIGAGSELRLAIMQQTAQQHAQRAQEWQARAEFAIKAGELGGARSALASANTSLHQLINLLKDPVGAQMTGYDEKTRTALLQGAVKQLLENTQLLQGPLGQERQAQAPQPKGKGAQAKPGLKRPPATQELDQLRQWGYLTAPSP